MAEMKMKEFKRKWEAQKFIEEQGTGYYEGPFLNDKMESTYLVFWNEKSTNTVWDVEFNDRSQTTIRISGVDVTLEKCIEILKYRGNVIEDIVSMRAREEKI